MSDSFKIKLYLNFILLLVGALPFFASYYFLDQLVSYQIDVSKRINIEQNIDRHKEHLKELSKLNPEDTIRYKQEFEKLHEQQIVVSSQSGLWSSIKSSLSKTYLIAFGGFAFILILLGFVMSQKISGIYSHTYNQLMLESERKRYLQQFENVAEIIKSLNHELKKPLGPIEIWFSNLVKAYYKNNSDFESKLIQTEKVISEEILNLKKYMSSFNKYLMLPEPELTVLSIKPYISHVFEKFKAVYTNVNFYIQNIEDTEILLDRNLISQVFQNLIENAIEANPDQNIKIEVFGLISGENYRIRVFNTGIEIKDLDSIFNPHFTTKADKLTSGLGLTICKSTIIKHGGDLIAINVSGGAAFELIFPIRTL